MHCPNSGWDGACYPGYCPEHAPLVPESLMAEISRAADRIEFERRLKENAPRSIDPLEWAIYNQWVSEQRTQFNQKESKP